jgi:hypothetical protein
MLAWCRFDGGNKRGMYRNFERSSRLALLDGDHSVANVLASHSDYVGAALRRIEQQRES